MAKETRKSVAIIGGGVAGLVSLKECLAEGLDAELFESRDEIGGQWAYQAVRGGDTMTAGGEEEIQSSMYDGVIMNSCRDTSSFSDFPLDPARYPDFLSHRQMHQYLREYAAHFGLMKHVRLRTRTVACRPEDDGRWTVTVQSHQDKDEDGIGAATETRTYDAVIAASGQHSVPAVPEFEGRDQFRGELLHSRFYRTPGRFEGKRVALIGLGSGALDLSCELAPACEEVHVVTRRGGWILPRYVLGRPVEAFDNRATQVWVPHSVSEYLQVKLINLVEGKHPKALKPEHGLMAQNPAVRGDFLEKVRTGAIRAHRTTVERFTPTGLRLSDGAELDVDVIISCTGYHTTLPYLPDDVLAAPGTTPPNTFDLWNLLVPVRYRNLFVVGFFEGPGPSMPPFEAQARLAAAAISGRTELPPPQQMERELRRWQAWHRRTFVESERHATAVRYVSYIDRMLAPLGANPTFARLLARVFTSGRPWAAIRTLAAVYFGITSSAQWRLCGYGRDNLAAETVLRIADRREELTQAERERISAR